MGWTTPAGVNAWLKNVGLLYFLPCYAVHHLRWRPLSGTAMSRFSAAVLHLCFCCALLLSSWGGITHMWSHQHAVLQPAAAQPHTAKSSPLQDRCDLCLGFVGLAVLGPVLLWRWRLPRLLWVACAAVLVSRHCRARPYGFFCARAPPVFF
jgi:hypothetical protein